MKPTLTKAYSKYNNYTTKSFVNTTSVAIHCNLAPDISGVGPHNGDKNKCKLIWRVVTRRVVSDGGNDTI